MFSFVLSCALLCSSSRIYLVSVWSICSIWSSINSALLLSLVLLISMSFFYLIKISSNEFKTIQSPFYSNDSKISKIQISHHSAILIHFCDINMSCQYFKNILKKCKNWYYDYYQRRTPTRAIVFTKEELQRCYPT